MKSHLWTTSAGDGCIKLQLLHVVSVCIQPCFMGYCWLLPHLYWPWCIPLSPSIDLLLAMTPDLLSSFLLCVNFNWQSHVLQSLRSTHNSCHFLEVQLFRAAFGTALTDFNFASTYGKLTIFLFAAWAGAAGQGVIAGLVLCSVVLATVYSSTELMQARLQSLWPRDLADALCSLILILGLLLHGLI